MNAQRSETEFVDGLTFKPPHERAPDFVRLSGGMHRERLIAWLQQQQGEWVNFDVKESRNGKLYAAVNAYKRDAEQPSRAPVKERPQPDQGNAADASNGDPFGDDIPFMPHGKRAHWIA